ncbi:uncharacterized protein LOC127863396 isoform X2 [Dreissena polymorpha]|uniref:Uncharacterized protein n=1 Tax=Dreissena polymorpha TaxID=45954 RepID=A0A9D4BEP7_DREPO|nr:uncharacterized protein LOC127863396 isoform X2 [Dreissena polymorpha]KAH3692341.1 hypothetical protein DPMN_194791 [Dreissena polymorpha]
MSHHQVFDRDRLQHWLSAMLSDVPEEQGQYDPDSIHRRQLRRAASHFPDPEERNRIISRTVRQLHEIVSRNAHQTGDDIRRILTYEFVRAQLYNHGHNGNHSSVSNRATLNAYRPGRWHRYIDESGRHLNVDKMMRSGGSGEDMARQYDTGWSSADDVDADDADESSMSTNENDAHVTDNGVFNGSDNNEPHEDPYSICDRCVHASHDEANCVDGGVSSVSSFVSIVSQNFKRPRRVIKSVKAFVGRFVRCQCIRPTAFDE